MVSTQMSIYKTHLKIEHLVDIPDITRQGAEITENVLDTDVMLGVTWGTDQGRVGKKITGGALLSRPKCVVQVYYDCIRQTGCVL